jgi:Antitoxin-like ribbon-helix-helix
MKPQKKTITHAVRTSKLFYLQPEYITAFNVLAAEQGPRSGPKLIEEAITLLLRKYGKASPL